MRFTQNTLRFVLPVLVIALVAALLVVVCPDGVHAGFSGMSSSCRTMTHSAGLGSAVESSAGQLAMVLLAMVAIALTMPLFMIGRRRVSVPIGHSPASPPDPLNGRLRI